MKSAINRIKSIIGILVFIHCYGDLIAQCPQRIEISNIVIDQQETSASLDLKVVAKEIYKGQLIRIDGTEEVLIKSFSGSGDELFSFAGLNFNKDVSYRVIIEYDGEERFLCKRRVKDIIITHLK